MKQDIVLIGAGGHAKVVLDIVEREGKYRLIGIIDSFKKKGDTFLDYEILGTEKDLSAAASKDVAGIIAVGDNWVRHNLATQILEICPAFEFVSTVHPTACIGRDVSIGKGSVVMAGAVINPCSRVGEFCIVNTAATLDHDNVLADYASVAPGVTVGGAVNIGAFSSICIGATISHGLTIGEHCVVGAGATVLDNLPPGCVAYGTPAQVVRQRKPGEKYL